MIENYSVYVKRVYEILYTMENRMEILYKNKSISLNNKKTPLQQTFVPLCL